ncbi:unnamed protein product, partial [Laminaria digitata]
SRRRVELRTPAEEEAVRKANVQKNTVLCYPGYCTPKVLTRAPLTLPPNTRLKRDTLTKNTHTHILRVLLVVPGTGICQRPVLRTDKGVDYGLMKLISYRLPSTLSPSASR